MREWGVCRVAFGRLGGGAVALTGKLTGCHVRLGALHDAPEREHGVLRMAWACSTLCERGSDMRAVWAVHDWWFGRCAFGVWDGRMVWKWIQSSTDTEHCGRPSLNEPIFFHFPPLPNRI